MLEQLKFLNTNKVTSDMKFGYKDFLCHYMETPTKWSTDWSFSGKETYQYKFRKDGEELVTPPSGIRSAVPIGGIGAGTFEIRSDGSFADFNIFNNHPGCGYKVQLKDTSFMLKVKSEDISKSIMLRTHAPHGFPSVDEIEYSGAFPVSRLKFSQNDLPVDVKLDAYSSFKMYNAEKCAVPAAIFTFTVKNTSDKAMETDIGFYIPNHVGGHIREIENGARLEGQSFGSRKGSACIIAEGADCARMISADCVEDIFENFSNGNSCKGYDDVAVIASLNLRAFEEKTFTMVYAWYYPDRYFNNEKIGNYYTTLYDNSEDVARKTLDRLDEIQSDILAWQELCFSNGLPNYLQDVLLNSMATFYVTSMWSVDNRYRQYESFSCSAIESFHIHFYRSIPLAMFLPELLKNLLDFAMVSQGGSNGWVTHEMGRPYYGNFDSYDFRRDNNPLFILDMYQYARATGDKEYLEKSWKNVIWAIDWELEMCKELGLPTKIASTYDLDKFEDMDNTAYNTFCYLASMLAGMKMAKMMGDDETYNKCEQALNRGQENTVDRLWNGSYYAAWWNKDTGSNTALHSDSLYGQLWAFILDLGLTDDAERLNAHLDAELKENMTPYGLALLTHTDDAYEKSHSFYTTWEAGTLDWTALKIYLGKSVEESLKPTETIIEKWRVDLKDQWDIRDLYTYTDGYPWCNSHYARQLIFWSIPMAISGQQYNAMEKSLSFNIAQDVNYEVPWFTTSANGTVKKSGEKIMFKVLSGTLDCDSINICGVTLNASGALTQGFEYNGTTALN